MSDLADIFPEVEVMQKRLDKSTWLAFEAWKQRDRYRAESERVKVDIDVLKTTLNGVKSMYAGALEEIEKLKFELENRSYNPPN